MDWFAVEIKTNVLEKKLNDRPEFSVETALKGNDRLTRFMLEYQLIIICRIFRVKGAEI